MTEENHTNPKPGQPPLLLRLDPSNFHKKLPRHKKQHWNR